MLTVQEIKKFIDSDKASEKKRQAEVGMRYYEAEHDIRKYRIFFLNNDGKLQEDKTKSNIKISHPFFTELVDQCVQYMLSGKDGFIRSDKPELQHELDAYFNENEDFVSELYELLTGVQVKGFEYMYAYKNKDDRTAFKCADAMGVVEVQESETEDKCAYVIYWYKDRLGKDNKEIRRIQVWDDRQTTYFCQVNDGPIVQDESQKVNPRPHILYKMDGDESTYTGSYGMIPFFRMDNCRKQYSALKPIKPLIDDYDLMSCGLSNNIQDTAEALYVIKGYNDDNLDAVRMNINAKKMIGTPDEKSDVEVRTVDVPYQARVAKLELDEKNIYRFGMGFNSSQIGDGNITNIVIKSRYALLDLKCNKLEISLKQLMRKLLNVVLPEINERNRTDYKQENVYFHFEREVMTNAADNAQIELTDAQKQQVQVNTLQGLETKFDNETLMKNICEVLDIDYDEISDKLPKQEEIDPYQSARTALDNIPVGGIE